MFGLFLEDVAKFALESAASKGMRREI